MYKFIDVNQYGVGTALPPEAMKYDGVYLENEIPGYRTLYVTGRELFESEIQNEKITGLDGSIYYGKTYPPRTITVGYQLIAESNTAFRSAFNKMNQILSSEQVQVIFNDEPDKYFIGTKVGNDIPNPGTNSIVSEFEIYCTDPKKYATTLKEFTASLNGDGVLECTIKNKGSMPANIEYEIINQSENGYIGIVSENGVMEFGSKEELDKETVKNNEMLVTIDDFFNASDDVGGYDAMHPNYGTSGTLAKKKMAGDGYWIGFGTQGTRKGNASGGLRTVTIPADSSGKVGAKNFYCWIHALFYAGMMGQTGEMSVSFVTADNKFICGYNWHKTDASGNTYYYEFNVYNPNGKSTDLMIGRTVKTFTQQANHLNSQNPFYWNWGNTDISKEGSKITFYNYSQHYSYVVPEVENMECAKIQIACKVWQNRTGNKQLKWFGFDAINFQKLGVEKLQDVPNRYSAGSTVRIDGEHAKIYVNDMPKQEDEILGTQYFKAPSGDSVVNFYTSEWNTTKPTIKARIREAWL